MISYSRELRRQRDIYDVLMQSNPCVDDNNEIYEQSNFFKDQIELPELDRALNTLNRRYRYILFARAVEGRSFEEIGAELGLDYKGVAAIYYRARNKIRKEMGEKYEFWASDDSLQSRKQKGAGDHFSYVYLRVKSS